MICTVCQATNILETNNGFCLECGSDVSVDISIPFFIKQQKVQREFAEQYENVQKVVQEKKARLEVLTNEKKILEDTIQERTKINLDLEIQDKSLEKQQKEKSALQKRWEYRKQIIQHSNILIQPNQYKAGSIETKKKGNHYELTWHEPISNPTMMLVLRKSKTERSIIGFLENADYFIILDKYFENSSKEKFTHTWRLKMPKFPFINDQFKGIFSNYHQPQQIRIMNLEVFDITF